MGRSAIHPGEQLAEQLEALAMSAAELGRQLGVPTNRITAILNGQRAITGDTALRLGHFFGNSPQFWLNLQALYDLRTAETKIGSAVRALPTLSRQRRTTASRPVRRDEEAVLNRSGRRSTATSGWSTASGRR